MSPKVGCLNLGQTSNPSSAWKKADDFKINSSDDDDNVMPIYAMLCKSVMSDLLSLQCCDYLGDGFVPLGGNNKDMKPEKCRLTGKVSSNFMDGWMAVGD